MDENPYKSPAHASEQAKRPYLPNRPWEIFIGVCAVLIGVGVGATLDAGPIAKVAVGIVVGLIVALLMTADYKRLRRPPPKP